MKIDYRDILKAFSSQGIDYVIVGGFACIAHGVVRVTMDLDLAIHVTPRDLKSTWEVLSGLGFICRQPIRQNEFQDPETLKKLGNEKGANAISFFHERQPYLVVDILFTQDFQFSPDQVVRLELFGVSCPVATIERLVELKKVAGRPKDLEDIRELELIRSKA